ncbi:hypothetical protein FZEAL_4713 [Fusarium zealandicum]|uniref:Transcription initiation factor IIF subunit beta n=1 Tax=Fusarium zealandicum TaxID=1053134 RepID=A0A8H4UL73_9HYPO|nr:hypothetical protein FZEAL_4713 [Fusarium zealandicum]
MADPQIKTDPYIKPDPEGSASPGPAEEEDLYEDAGDLEFYDKNTPNHAFETLYLARVPRYMWTAWMKLTERLGDNDEIQIGTLRTWTEQKPDGSADTKLRMLLANNCPEHQLLPREYDLEVLEPNVSNHFIFSEEDLPGFKARSKARQEAANAGIPASLLRQRAANNSGAEKPTYDRRSRYQPYYRKAVPKRTKVFGKVHYDVRVESRDRREEEQLLAQRIQDAEMSKSKLQIISRNKASTITNPGSAGSINWGSNFVKNTAPTTKPKKGEIFKAARIPENQLLDLIFECFRQYQYWSMKALRQKLQQPDQYLRQVLEKIAVLNKSGRFANHYCLSDAYRDKGGAESKEAAAEPVDDEDEDEEMEDVLPGAYIIAIQDDPAYHRLNLDTNLYSASNTTMHLIFDFDGTITQQDTIGELARFAIEIQRNIRGQDLQASWDQVVQSYVADYRHYQDNHPSPEDTRKCVKDEVRFLSGMKDVEETSLARVAESRVFAGLDEETLSQAGADAVKEGRVKIRKGFPEVMSRATERGWSVSVVSVNWSRAFIRGALRPHSLEVIANEAGIDGSITGPEFLGGQMTNAGEKRKALEHLVKDGDGKVVYFGDSTTDMECLLAGGVVISDDEESTLLKTLRRVGVPVPHVGEPGTDGKVSWARDFQEVLDSATNPNITSSFTLKPNMCKYARVVFACTHIRWGLMVQPCGMADDFRTGKASHDCVVKQPHALTSRKLERKCDGCIALEAGIDKLKKGIEEVRGLLKEVERKREAGRGDEEVDEDGKGEEEKE